MVVWRLQLVLIKSFLVLEVHVAEDAVIVPMQLVLLQFLERPVVLVVADADVASNLLGLDRKLPTRLVCPECLLLWRW